MFADKKIQTDFCGFKNKKNWNFNHSIKKIIGSSDLCKRFVDG